MNPFRFLYLNTRFFVLLSGIILWFCLSFFLPFLFLPGVYLFVALLAVTLIDILWLFGKMTMISGKRTSASRLSLSDENEIVILLRNHGNRNWYYELVDELPYQLQERNFSISGEIKALSNDRVRYHIRPLQRGEYHFGVLNVYLMSNLKLVRRRAVLPLQEMVPVYPSIIQMKRFDIYNISKISRIHGIKKMRRIGLSYEFEQIKPYVRGDDVRQINWKATARSQGLMINQYEDEKSQAIYNVIDKSRIMLMPFNGLSLMDYAINTSLVISNVALSRYDKAGLVTFSDKLGAVIKADRKHGQLQSILESLYNQKERDLEANYELLYHGLKNMVKSRSLIFLYSNFESMYGLKRVMPILRKINREHVLVMIFFENSELEHLSREEAGDLKGIYRQVLAEQAMNDKGLIAYELNNMGIQTILSKPEELSLNTINKYLEIKSRGIL